MSAAETGVGTGEGRRGVGRRGEVDLGRCCRRQCRGSQGGSGSRQQTSMEKGGEQEAGHVTRSGNEAVGKNRADREGMPGSRRIRAAHVCALWRPAVKSVEGRRESQEQRESREIASRQLGGLWLFVCGLGAWGRGGVCVSGGGP